MHTEREERGKQAGLRTWGLYLLALAAWVTAVLALIFIGFLVCTRITWYESNPLYHLLDWVRNYIIFVGTIVAVSYTHLDVYKRQYKDLSADLQ